MPLPDYENAKLKDYMSFRVHPKKGNWAYISIWTGPYYRTILEKDAVISYTKEIKFDQLGIHIAFASLSLDKVEDLNSSKSSKEHLGIGTEKINILVAM